MCGAFLCTGRTIFHKKTWKVMRLLQLASSKAMLQYMKKSTLKNLLIASLLLTPVSYAGLYKGLDGEGNVIYSDKPFGNAVEYTPPPISVMDAPKEAARETAEEVAEEKPVAFKYTDFDIISPTHNQTIWNEPDLTVSLQLKPALNTDKKHTVWLLRDNKAVVENSQAMALQIGRSDRGAHTLQAQVRDESGKILARTRTIIVHIKNAVVKKPAP